MASVTSSEASTEASHHLVNSAATSDTTTTDSSVTDDTNSTSTDVDPSTKRSLRVTSNPVFKSEVTSEPDEDEERGRLSLGNPTTDALQDGLIGLLRPTIEKLDNRVTQTRAAQAELREHVEALTRDLEDIKAAQAEADKDSGLDEAVEKLNNAKKRVVVVANLLQGAQDRLNRVHQGCLKETARRRNQLEPSPTTPSAGNNEPKSIGFK